MRVTGKNVFNELDVINIRKIYLSKNFKEKNILNYITNYYNRIKFSKKLTCS